MIKADERFYNDLDQLNEASHKFENKEITPAEYKAISGGFGNYPQKGNEKLMLRLRLTGGRLQKEQMQCIIQCCKKHSVENMKVTTCQSLQLHDLTNEAVRDITKTVLDVNIVTRGGGGNHPRNVMASPLSGTDKNEYFNVLPYAEAAGKYLLQFAGIHKFPRKLKVGFSSSPENITHVTFRDLGFAANPDKTFNVYAAGGLGNNPKLGVFIDKNVDPEDILYYIKAMIDLFTEYGNYQNRAKARTRYLQETLGQDKIKELFLENVCKLKETEHLKLTVEDTKISKSSDTSIQETSRIKEQKQKNLYSVYYHPVGGFLTTDKFEEIYNTIENFNEVEIRLSPDGAMYIINCTSEEALKAAEVTNDSAVTQFQCSVSCVGQQRCSIGICDSQQLLKNCLEYVSKYNFKDGVLPKMHISGCVSSCSAHQSALLGFRGMMKRTDEGVKPAFCVYFGGCEEQNNEILSESNEFILAEKIPEFIAKLGTLISESNSTYSQWIKTNSQAMKDLIADYSL